VAFLDEGRLRERIIDARHHVAGDDSCEALITPTT
jgi:hypothetical protein